MERPALVALLLVLAVGVVYLPVVGFSFINFDDPPYITGNLQVMRGLTWEGVVWAFAHSCVANWHPVTWISHMLDCQLYGLNPWGHHFTNLVLHSTDSVLVFLLLRYLTGAFWRSLLVGALFALHPVHVESVAWVSERKDVLSAFFGLLCLWAYAAYAKEIARQPQAQAQESVNGPEIVGQAAPHGLQISAISQHRATLYYWLALGLFALSLMSKAMLVTWPCVMLLLDFWPLRRFNGLTFSSGLSRKNRLRAVWRLVVEKLPFFALSAAVSVITFVVVKAWGGVAASVQVPLALRIANVPVNYVRYLGKLIWPSNLAVVYPYIRQWPPRDVAACILVLAGATLLAVWQRHRRPYLLTGWLFYLGTLVPVIGLVQAGSQSIADRFTYLPSIGMFIMLSWCAAELVGTAAPRKAMAGLAAGTALMICALFAQAQVQYWQNTETLFRHALVVTTNNSEAYSNLGLYYAFYREHEEAKRCYRAALAVQPADSYAWNGLAMALINQGKYDEALLSCQAALQVDPGMALAHCTLGLALNKLGRIDEALAQYSEALRLEPSLADAHYNLANVLAAKGQIESAVEHYAAATRLNPGSADAHNNLAYMLAREGKLDAAVAEFRSALTLEPNLWQAHYGLAGALNRQGKTKEASEHYRQALVHRPDLVDALNRLAWILAASPESEVRQGAEAVRLAERACQLTQYQQAGLLSTLAAAYAEAGRFDEATNWADKAYHLALASGQTESARRSRQLLDLFRSGRSYHEAN